MSSTVSVQAAAAASFVQSIGINTHVDFSWTAYDNLAAVQDALFYLGVKNVRDAIDNPADPAKFAALNANLGVKFDFFIAPGSAGMDWQLAMIQSNPAIVRFVEGANESDNWPQSYAGLTGPAATAAEQRALYAAVKSTMPGVGVIGPSFGWLGSYALAGDLAAYSDYANAHVYFGTGNQPGAAGWIPAMYDLADAVAPGRPVAATETGYYTSSNLEDPHGVSLMVQAKYILNDVMDQFSAGVAVQYLYELVDQRPDPRNTDPQLHFGLFKANWTPKPAATAVHNLLQLLDDPGRAGFTPGHLDYSLSGMPATAHSMLLQKSDGTFVLALWNDVRLSGPLTGATIKVPKVPVMLTLADRAAKIDVFDPLTGTGTVREAVNARRIALNVPDHPILVEIGPNAGAPIVPPPPPPPLVGSPAGPTGVSVTAPAGVASLAGQDHAVAGVAVVDPWAAGIAASMLISISATRGTLAMADDGGNKVPGSGTGAITLTANLFQINTDLAHLSYHADAAGNDTITVDVWDPAGLQAMATIAVTTAAADSLPEFSPEFSFGDAAASGMPIDDLLPALAAPIAARADSLPGGGSAGAAPVGLMAWFLPAPEPAAPAHFWPT